MKVFSPYLSVVVACRNDSHRAELSLRLFTTIHQWSKWCRNFRLVTEYLIVEWNPPPENPPLKVMLKDAPVNDYFNIRIITVPSATHNKIDPQNILPLHQMIAKNVGIRKAAGLFVLCTNIDIFPDSLLLEELAKKNLCSGYYYRANRCDIPEKTVSVAVNDKESYARNRIIRRMGMNAQWPGLKIYKKQYWVYRYAVFKPLFPLLLITKRILLGEKKFQIARIDKEACGDFTLMSKEDWIRIMGYMEYPVYPLHIDTLALVRASVLGIKQHIFDKEKCVYHIEHEGSWREEIAHSLHINKPFMQWSDAEKLIVQMQQAMFSYNTSGWGLESESLPEEWVK